MDNNPLYRSGLKNIFEQLSYICAIEEAADAGECLDLLKTTVFSVALLNIHMPETDGVSCMKTISERWPKLKVIALSQFDELHSVNMMLNLGAVGHLMKGLSGEQLVRTFESILFGNRAALHRALGREEPRIQLLQNREIEILKLLCKQLSSKQIAERLCISKHTVDNHRKHLLRKTGMQNTAGLVSWAIRKGFTST